MGEFHPGCDRFNRMDDEEPDPALSGGSNAEADHEALALLSIVVAFVVAGAIIIYAAGAVNSGIKGLKSLEDLIAAAVAAVVIGGVSVRLIWLGFVVKRRIRRQGPQP